MEDDERSRLLDPTQVGQKFARLEMLRREGYRVPEFFCLSVDEFDSTLAATHPALAHPPTQDAGDAAIGSWCRAAAGALAAAVPTGELADRVLKAFDDHIGAEELAAVRACVVVNADGLGAGGLGVDNSAEDSAADPFAGMSESYLYVPREGVLAAIANCWASAFTPHAVRYRLHKGIDPTAARVAVGIQCMVMGTRSFVAFSKDPRDISADRLVIAAAYGIGEGVVQEKADVDHFFVESSSGQVRAEIVTKQWMVTAPKQRGDVPALVPVDADLAQRPVLSDEQARAVAALAAKIEDFFGCPQDIEGTITSDGQIHLVQARPMVISQPTPQVHWGNHNITESFPGISSALTYSQARVFYKVIFTDLYRRMGVSQASLQANAPLLGRMIGFLNGRIYYRLDDWQKLHSQMPVFEFIRPVWEQQMGISGDVRGVRQSSPLRAAASLLGIGWRALGHRRATEDFLAWWDELMDEVYSDDERSVDELIVLYRRVWDETSNRWGVTLANGIYALILLGIGTKLAQRWTGSGPELLIGLLAGGPENRTLAATRALIALAEQAAINPELRAALLDEDTDSVRLRVLWNRLSAGDYGEDIAANTRDYVRRYGDRALHDLKLDEPTPRQRPWILLETISVMVRQGLTVQASRADEAKMAASAKARLEETCGNPVQRAVLNRLVVMARWCAKAREDTRFCRTQLFGITREVMWRLGAELAQAGLLNDGQDVVDLTVEEVLGAFDGTLPGSDLRGLVSLRRAERLRNNTLPALPVLMSVPSSRPLAAALPLAVPAGDLEEPAAGDKSVLRGLGSTGGVIRGRAKIVLDPGVVPDECSGRILIARETDPGWLFLMIAAAGIVVERGTLLSHTAITGRLLGVPTVVAVQGATTSIPDGALIELDGAAGTVTILDEFLDERELVATESG